MLLIEVRNNRRREKGEARNALAVILSAAKNPRVAPADSSLRSE